MKPLFQIVLLFIINSCNYQSNEKKQPPQHKEQKPVVVLQPLEFNDTSVLNFLMNEIETLYPVNVIIEPSKTFPNHLYYKPRNRYRADRIIHWLRMNISDSARTIVGITNKDVSTTKGEVYDYGVMGLGYRPGRACVVSTFRPSKTARNKQHLQQRLLKLVLHEMGHNFNLAHCSNEECFMVDAEGQMKLDKERYLCTNCKSQLRF